MKLGRSKLILLNEIAKMNYIDNYDILFHHNIFRHPTQILYETCVGTICFLFQAFYIVV